MSDHCRDCSISYRIGIIAVEKGISERIEGFGTFADSGGAGNMIIVTILDEIIGTKYEVFTKIAPTNGVQIGLLRTIGNPQIQIHIFGNTTGERVILGAGRLNGHTTQNKITQSGESVFSY